MKIRDERNNGVPFHLISVGCCFECADNYYIKCDTCNSGTNAIHLESGRKTLITTGCVVRLLDVELVIKGDM